jgi:hypothetical protein
MKLPLLCDALCMSAVHFNLSFVTFLLVDINRYDPIRRVLPCWNFQLGPPLLPVVCVAVGALLLLAVD